MITVLTPSRAATSPESSTGALKKTRAAQGPAIAAPRTPNRPTTLATTTTVRIRRRTSAISPRSTAAVSDGSKNACTGEKKNSGIRASTNSETKLAAVPGSSVSREVNTTGVMFASSRVSAEAPARNPTPRAISGKPRGGPDTPGWTPTTVATAASSVPNANANPKAAVPATPTQTSTADGSSRASPSAARLAPYQPYRRCPLNRPRMT